jgi:hypothetical protein
VHYEALDVYEQHSPRILGVTKIPNPTYATTITTTFQVALQATTTHHGTMPNNPNSIPILIDLFPQQLIIDTTNILPTIDAPCRTSTLAKCGGEAQHLEKLGVGVLRNSRMFRARQQGAKHLALGVFLVSLKRS